MDFGEIEFWGNGTLGKWYFGKMGVWENGGLGKHFIFGKMEVWETEIVKNGIVGK